MMTQKRSYLLYQSQVFVSDEESDQKKLYLWSATGLSIRSFNSVHAQYCICFSLETLPGTVTLVFTIMQMVLQ